MPQVSGPIVSLGSVPTMNHSSTLGPDVTLRPGPRVDLDPDEAVGRLLEVGDRPLGAGLVEEALPDEGRDVDREERRPGGRHQAVVGVAVPDPDGEGVGAGVAATGRRRRDVAVGVEVLRVVVRAGLEGGRPATARAVDRELAPERVDARVGVAGQDVGHDEGRLRADRLLAGRRHVGRHARQVVAVGVLDGQDRRVADLLAAVGQRPVGRDEVDRPDLLDTQRQGELAPSRSPWKFIPKSLALANTRSGPLIPIVLTDGMLSENWSAFRTRTGPRSRLSASFGV